MGCARSESDIDLAYETHGNKSQTELGNAICNQERWQASLNALAMPVPVHLQHFDRNESVRVGPAVEAHGIRLL
jgi:hypothetical protein